MEYRQPHIIQRLDELLTEALLSGFVWSVKCWPDHTVLQIGKAQRVADEGKYTVTERFEVGMSDSEVEARFYDMIRRAVSLTTDPGE